MQRSIPQWQQLLARAVAAHQAGNLEQAKTLYQSVLQANKNQFDALHMLAVIEAQRGNFSESVTRLTEALRVQPKATDALINLGRMQGELGRYDEATKTYKADPKQSFIQLSAAGQAKWAKDTSAIDAEWVKQGSGREKVLTKFKELLAEAKAGK